MMLTDRHGVWMAEGKQVRITHPRHIAVDEIGRIVRLGYGRKRGMRTGLVWVKLRDGRIVQAGHRSVEIVRPTAA